MASAAAEITSMSEVESYADLCELGRNIITGSGDYITGVDDMTHNRLFRYNMWRLNHHVFTHTSSMDPDKPDPSSALWVTFVCTRRIARYLVERLSEEYAFVVADLRIAHKVKGRGDDSPRLFDARAGQRGSFTMAEPTVVAERWFNFYYGWINSDQGVIDYSEYDRSSFPVDEFGESEYLANALVAYDSDDGLVEMDIMDTDLTRRTLYFVLLDLLDRGAWHQAY